jgi:arsenite methyltransferase
MAKMTTNGAGPAAETDTGMSDDGTEGITTRVRERYAAAARRVSASGSCCGPAGTESVDMVEATDAAGVSRGLYAADEVEQLPEQAVLASLGCGNPTALIDLRPGETVLDLGSGGGIDVLLSARRVGPTGFAFGLDMTDEMLALAQENKAKAGASNVAFLKGRIEDIPLPARSVDVVISNCVINLSADKGQVLREAFRVLKPGGRFAVADVVAEGKVPEALRRDMEAWVGCLAGALEIGEYERLLRAAGFTDVSVTITKRYTAAGVGLDTAALPAGWEAFDGRLASAFVRAIRPAEDATMPVAHSEAQSEAVAPKLLPIAAAGGGCCGTGGCC